uniref:Uncharacterized protein n=1 Tax=Arundo donax TaxID=35708 RepID=A0A0A9CVK8_ARUDO
MCPSDLRVVAASGGGGGVIACRSACNAYGTPALLLHRSVRHAGGVRADQLLAGVQKRLPGGIQLRLRRRQQHLHMLRRLQL